MQFTRDKILGSGFLAFGLLVAMIVAVMLLAAGPAHASTTFTVNSNGDSTGSTPAMVLAGRVQGTSARSGPRS